MAKNEKEDSRKGIVFYFEWMRLLRRYPSEIRMMMRDAIDDYVLDGVTPDFGENIDRQLLFETFKNQIDRDLEKYKDLKEKRSLAGKKSAEVKQNQQVSTNPTNVNTSQQNQQVLTNPTNANNTIEIESTIENTTKTKIKTETENNKALSPFFGEEYCPLDPNKAELIAREYIQFFNQTVEGTMIPSVQEVTYQRIKLAWYNISKFGVDKMKEMTTKAAKSKFFNMGRCGFDWFMKEENLVKVLEGTYDDTDANNNQGQGAKGFGMGIQEQRHIRQLREQAGGDEEQFQRLMETAGYK